MKETITIEYALVEEASIFKKHVMAIVEQQPDLPLILKSFDIGADREQWFIEWQGTLFVICVEHLSESAWIEPLGAETESLLQNFYNLLFCH